MLNKARIRILAQVLGAFICLSLLLLVLYIFQEHNLLLVRMAIQLTLFTAGLVLLLSGMSWRSAGHYFVIVLSLIIWTNALFFRQVVNMVTVQYVLLIVSGGYYILGARWGLIYSLVNILPIIIFVMLAKYTGFDFSVWNQNINGYAFDMVLIFNFILLIFFHYFFFRAFQKTNQQEQELRAHLQRAVVAAEEMASAKTNFLSTMSHELRTPLNAVVGMANLLLTEGTQAERQENLEVLAFSAGNLMEIINDILDFNKIDAGMMTLDDQDFRLDTLLKNVHGAFKAEAAAKMIGFDFVMDPGIENLWIKGDQMRLTQILFNLVGNAVKFTLKGHVLLECKLVSRHHDNVTIHFRVEDSGIGISAEQQVNIFDPFIRTSARGKRQHHGTGLGLTIASRLVALHGSTLALHSTEGKGTKLDFGLNYKTADRPVAEQPDPVSKPDTTGKPLKVLVAEDNALNVLLLKKILKKWGIEPVIAENGQIAVEAVVAGDFDVILMDINMPVMDGLEASRTIRELKDPKKAGIHIIACTASIEQHEDYSYMDDRVLKPFNPALLKEKLDRLSK